MPEKCHVVIIIINYKTFHLIPGVINSIHENNIQVSILIVDNSPDIEHNEKRELIGMCTNINILSAGKNLGFTGGINFALEYIEENLPDIKYFFLLNPDAFSAPNIIGNLLSILRSYKIQEAVVISPKIVYKNGEPWYSGAKIDFQKGTVINNPPHNEKNSEYFEVDAYNGCAALFNFDKVKEVGMFNEKLFMYYDEADLSKRLINIGYKILYAPNLNIIHDVSYSTKGNSYLKSYYMTRNKFFVFGDSITLYHKFYFLAYEFLFHLKNLKFKNAFYHLKGYYDFKKGKSGNLFKIR